MRYYVGIDIGGMTIKGIVLDPKGKALCEDVAVTGSERGGDAKMWFFNSDGSVGEMCGNGARCFGRFVYEHFAPKDEIVIEATSGNVPAWRQTDRLYKVLLNRPTVLRTGWPTQDADGGPLRAAYVELGDPGLPHLVVPVPGLAEMEDYAQRLFEEGRKLRSHPLLPKGANVNFCQVTGPHEVLIRTYERGVEDFTLACGTGSGSTVAALQAMGLLAKGAPVTVHNPGDDLIIDCRWAGEAVEQLFLIEIQQPGGRLPFLDVHCLHKGVVRFRIQHPHHFIPLPNQHGTHKPLPPFG